VETHTHTHTHTPGRQKRFQTNSMVLASQGLSKWAIWACKSG